MLWKKCSFVHIWLRKASLESKGWGVRLSEGQTHLTFRWIISSLRPHVSLPLSTGSERQSLWPPPAPIPFSAPSHPSLLVALSVTHCWTYPSPPPAMSPPEGIIFTLTTSINLTPSCTQTHTHTCALSLAHTHTHTHTYIGHTKRACTHTPSHINHRC